MKNYKILYICFFLTLIVVLLINTNIADAQVAPEADGDDESVIVVTADGYDPKKLQPTKYPDLEEIGWNIIKLWGGSYLTTDDHIYFSYINTCDGEISVSHSYILETEIDGKWYQLMQKDQVEAIALRMVPGGNFYCSVKEEDRPTLYPGKHRIVSLNSYNTRIYYYYGEFVIVEPGSNLPEKPSVYDCQFLHPARSLRVEDDWVEIIKIKNQPITTADEYIHFTIDIETNKETYWYSSFSLEAEIEGKWYHLVEYTQIDRYDEDNKFQRFYYAINAVGMVFGSSIVAELTLDKVSLYKDWEPAGPFAGRHRIKGNLMLENGGPLISVYGEFDIVDATDTALTSASAWAQESVKSAIPAGLVPQNLQNNYQQPITRAEFTALAVALYEKVTGEEITKRRGFSDTKDINVEKAAAIGIANGAANGKFSPDTPLTREQAATMLSRLADALDKPLAKHTTAFADSGAVSSWAIEAVGQMQAVGVMNGTGDNKFSPKVAYTREQSIVTIMRLYYIVH